MNGRSDEARGARAEGELRLQGPEAPPPARCFELLAATLPEGVAVLDSDGGLRFANAVARQLLLRDASADDAATEAELRDALERMQRSCPEWGARVVGQLELSGDHVDVEVLRVEGDGGGLLFRLLDARRERALDVDLHMAARMRALVDLYRAYAHDLKAPLNAIGLGLELLAGQLEDVAGLESAGERVALLQQELERLGRMLDGLLAQTAPGGDRTERFLVRAVFEKMAVLVEPLARRQGVEIERRFPASTVEVYGQPDQLEQALLSVVFNALQAMPEGGALRIELSVEPDALEIRIADEGGGIPADVLPRIFERHFSTRENGSGIGLYIARRIIVSMGGTLRVESTSPAGTTFLARLPAAESREEA